MKVKDKDRYDRIIKIIQQSEKPLSKYEIAQKISDVEKKHVDVSVVSVYLKSINNPKLYSASITENNRTKIIYSFNENQIKNKIYNLIDNSALNKNILPNYILNDNEKYNINKSNKICYIISDGEYYKIGCSNNPYLRLIQLQTSCSKKLSLIITTSIIEESKMHKIFNKYRVHGEWFKIPENHLKNLIDILTNLEKFI